MLDEYVNFDIEVCNTDELLSKVVKEESDHGQIKMGWRSGDETRNRRRKKSCTNFREFQSFFTIWRINAKSFKRLKLRHRQR